MSYVDYRTVQTIVDETGKVRTERKYIDTPKTYLQNLSRSKASNSGNTNSASNPWLFVVRNNVDPGSTATLPILYHYPHKEDFDDFEMVEVNVRDSIRRNDFDEDSGDVYLKSTALLQADVSGRIFIPRPAGYAISDLQIFDVIGDFKSSYEIGYRIFREVETGNYWLLSELAFSSVEVHATFTPETQSNIDAFPELNSLNGSTLRELAFLLRELNFLRLADAIEAAANKESLSVSDLENIFANNLFYTHEKENKRKGKAAIVKNPNNPFASFCRFEKTGDLYLECDGSNDLFISFLQEYLNREELTAVYGVKTQDSFVRQLDKHYITLFPGHRQTLLYRRDGSARLVLDVTPHRERNPNDLAEPGDPIKPPLHASRRVLRITQGEVESMKERLTQRQAQRKARYHELQTEMLESSSTRSAVATGELALPHKKAIELGDALIKYSDGDLSAQEMIEMMRSLYPFALEHYSDSDPGDQTVAEVLATVVKSETDRYSRFANDPKRARFELGDRFKVIYQTDYLSQALALLDFLGTTEWIPVEKLVLRYEEDRGTCEVILSVAFT